MLIRTRHTIGLKPIQHWWRKISKKYTHNQKRQKCTIRRLTKWNRNCWGQCFFSLTSVSFFVVCALCACLIDVNGEKKTTVNQIKMCVFFVIISPGNENVWQKMVWENGDSSFVDHQRLLRCYFSLSPTHLFHFVCSLFFSLFKIFVDFFLFPICVSFIINFSMLFVWTSSPKSCPFGMRCVLLPCTIHHTSWLFTVYLG